MSLEEERNVHWKGVEREVLSLYVKESMRIKRTSGEERKRDMWWWWGS
jgi:hypothetical protein